MRGVFDPNENRYNYRVLVSLYQFMQFSGSGNVSIVQFKANLI